MRSVPKPSAGHGLSAASQSVADCVELTPVSLELLALGVDDVRRRARGEALVGEHALGARDLLLESCDLRIEVAAVVLRGLGQDDGGEGPLLVDLTRRGDHASL